MRVETILPERFCPRSVPCHHSSSLFGIIHQKDRVIQRQHMQQFCPRNPDVRDSLVALNGGERRLHSLSGRYHGTSAIESGIGPKKAIYRCLASLELFVSSPSRRSGAQSRETTKSQPNPLLALSASQATWLFFRKEEDLKAEEQENLRLLRQASPDLETAYQLVKEFLQMVRELTGERLEEWLGKVEAEALQAFQPFVTGVQQDKDAVLAGLTLPWSNGPLEGNVNRLKLIKRSMYGQADLNLLKLRVLHQSPKSLERKNKKKQAQQQDPLDISRGRKKDTNFQHITNEISKVA